MTRVFQDRHRSHPNALVNEIRDIPGRYDRLMSGSDEHYRAKADECRQKAARLAEAWLALARHRPQSGLERTSVAYKGVEITL